MYYVMIRSGEVFTCPFALTMLIRGIRPGRLTDASKSAVTTCSWFFLMAVCNVLEKKNIKNLYAEIYII